MRDMKHELAELTASLFSPDVESAGDVTQAARQILHIYSALLELKKMSDELAAIGGAQFDDATKHWNSFRRKRGPLDQVFRRQEPMDPGSTNGKLSWEKVKLLSHDLRYHVASLKFRNRTLGGSFAFNEQDANVLANYGQTVESIQDEMKQLEQQMMEVPAEIVSSTAGSTDQPELHFVDKVCGQCKVLQHEVDSANGSLEAYKVKEAVELVEAGMYDDAVAIYEELCKVRKLEIDRKWTLGDKEGASDTEIEALKIKCELATVFMLQGKLPEAEDAIHGVWERRRSLLPRNHRDTNSAQQQLCSVFRAQRSNSKYKAAGRLYDAVWSDPDLEAGDVWVMDNGHELGMVLIEQGSFLKAEGQLGEVLEARRNALGEQNQATVETAAQLAALMAERGRAKESVSLLQPFLTSGGEIFSPKALECAATIGERLFEVGEYPDTERVCRMVWNNAEPKPGARPAAAARSAGWHLSLALYFQNQGAKYEEAKCTLNALLRPSDVVDPFRILKIKSLLSWVCRKVKDFQQAAEFAQWVWERKGDADVLGPLFSSTGVNRIWLLSRHEEKQDKEEAERKLKDARLAWKEILRTTGTRSLSYDEKNALAQSWRDLAKDLDRFAKQRKRRGGSSLARTIERAAADLKQ